MICPEAVAVAVVPGAKEEVAAAGKNPGAAAGAGWLTMMPCGVR